MEIYEIAQILNNCKFRIFDTNFSYWLAADGNAYTLQVKAKITCTERGGKCWQKGGKHRISRFACPSEIVNKYWKACQDFVMHEMREGFTYRGRMIYQPHWDVDALAEACDKFPIARREADYEGFARHVRWLEQAGAPIDRKELEQIAHLYNCPVFKA